VERTHDHIIISCVVRKPKGKAVCTPDTECLILIVSILKYLSECKVKLSLCLTKYYAMKAYGGNRCIDSHFPELGISWR
jgi:hypothetical protein